MSQASLKTLPEAPSRRSFLGRLLAGSLLSGALAVIGSALAYLYPAGEDGSRSGSGRVKVGKSEDLSVGEGKLALVGGQAVWVIRLAKGFVALSAVCPHKGCRVKWESERRLFRCPCHEGLFDEHGNVISGLPRQPLASLRVGLVEDAVYVSFADHREA